MDALRLAVLSTPRTGGTWLRHLLAAVYGLDESPPAQVTIDDLVGRRIPARLVLHNHVPPNEERVGRLRSAGFIALTTVRHPIDMLISILHLAQDPRFQQAWFQRSQRFGWSEIVGATPRSEAFVSFATGPAAADLLAISFGWWQTPQTTRVRYESLWADPPGQLRQIVDAVGRPVAAAIDTAVAAHGIERERKRQRLQFAWQGEPGRWRTLVPADVASQIRAAHASVFETLGYDCDPDEALGAEEADLNWYRLEAASAADFAHELQQRLSGLGPTALAVARGFQGVADRLPRSFTRRLTGRRARRRG